MADIFDYVIVGAGSAGSVLAHRLAAAGGKTVCVLEAGPPDSNPFIRVPAGFIKTLVDPRVTWQFDSAPSRGTDGRQIRLIQGRTLGGSSAINGAIYNRGHAADFDGWAALGNRGWSYREVLPYFKRSERRIGPGDDRYRGRDGELPITTTKVPNAVCEAFIRGAMENGAPLNPDYNGASQDGVGYYQSTIEKGRRVSAAHAFLRPAERRGVTVRTHTQADRILFEGSRAVGVHYRSRDGGNGDSLQAREAVIVCAGAFNTPKLLQLSGLGPASLLRGRGIAVVQDLPGVGENLQDHLTGRLVARGRPGMDSINARVKGLRLVREIAAWLVGRPSLLAVSPAWLHYFGRSAPGLPGPDFMLVFTPGSYKLGLVGKLDDFPGISCGGCQLRPESRGHVRIASGDAREAPQIQPNYLSAEADQRLMVTVLRTIRSLLQTAPMRALIEAETLPGPGVSSDDEWLDFARRYAATAFHFVGTAKMGPADDRMAVVDDQLRVRGVEGLRIADTSVMPTLVSANTYAAAVMIGEKAADMILGRAALPPADLS